MMSASQELTHMSSDKQHIDNFHLQYNSLVTLADLALNCSNNDRDHSYAVENKSLSRILDEECLVQKEKDHTYAIGGRNKSVMHRTLGPPKHHTSSTTIVPRRSSSEENVSNTKHFEMRDIHTCDRNYWTTQGKKSQSYAEILKENNCPDTGGSEIQSIGKEHKTTFLAPLGAGPMVKHLKIAGDLASPYLPRRDHTYAAANRSSDTDVEMACDGETELNKIPGSVLRTHPTVSSKTSQQSRSYSNHLYTKPKVNNSSQSVTSANPDNKVTNDLSIWSRKSDHSYFTFDEQMREQMLGLISNSKLQPHHKREKMTSRSDHTYFSRA